MPTLTPNPEDQLDPMAVPAASPVDPIRAQILAALQQRMQNQAPVDVAPAQQSAKDAGTQSNLLRSGVALGQAFLGKQTDGDNLWSKQLEGDSAKDLATALGNKKTVDDENAKRQALRDSLAGKFVDSQEVQDRDAAKSKEAAAIRADQNTNAKDIAKGNNTTSIEVAKINAANKGGGSGSDQKLINALRDDLDPNKARAGNLAKSQSMVNQAERVNGLFEQFPDGNVPKAQTHELAAAVAGLVNGGSAQSQKQIDELTPQSFKGNSEALAGWITNDPKGLQQQKFMEVLKHTADREREIAMDQVRQAQIQRLPAHNNLKTSNPDTYNALLNSYGITPDMMDEKGHYKKQAGKAGHAEAAESFPRDVFDANGRKATVSSPDELKEAQKEGFK